jgi:hypothetical protein
VFITNHALAGAAIGQAARRPVPAFLAGVASHLVMDVCLPGVTRASTGTSPWRWPRSTGPRDWPRARRRWPPPPGPRGCRWQPGSPGPASSTWRSRRGTFSGGQTFPPGFDGFHGRIQTERPIGWVVEAAAAATLVAMPTPALGRARARLHRTASSVLSG